jgi:multidrug resistance efflux pump
MQASVNVAEATLKQAQWQLTQTVITAPVDGWVTNLSPAWGTMPPRDNRFCPRRQPLLLRRGLFRRDQASAYSRGFASAITLYSGSQTLQGHVSSIGRAIYDQSVETDSGLVPDIKPNVPWVRLAQRVPVRVEFDRLPQDITLVSGTTCTVSIGNR